MTTCLQRQCAARRGSIAHLRFFFWLNHDQEFVLAPRRMNIQLYAKTANITCVRDETAPLAIKNVVHNARPSITENAAPRRRSRPQASGLTLDTRLLSDPLNRDRY